MLRINISYKILIYVIWSNNQYSSNLLTPQVLSFSPAFRASLPIWYEFVYSISASASVFPLAK